MSLLTNKSQALIDKLNSIPKKPGCYLWKNANNEIIYVGKAKNLFNRTHQYFNKQVDLKTSKLVTNICDVDYIIVSNENEALILEQNLINDLKPKYNVLLRENKNYPFIVVTNEKYPCLKYKFLKKITDKKNYRTIYGPFISGSTFDIYNVLNRIFPFRKCAMNQQRPCMYYGINQCLCPQVHAVDPHVFDEMCSELDDFFHGNSSSIIQRLITQEKNAAQKLNFELAEQYKKLRDNLEKLLTEQVVDLQNKNCVDIFAFARKENVIAINIFQYINGILKNKHEKISIIYGSTEEEMINYLFQYYSIFKFHQEKNVVISLNLENQQLIENELKIKILNPTKGKLHEVMLLSLKNAENCLEKNFDAVVAKAKRKSEALEALSKLINVDDLTMIDMIDNSNLFNQSPVGAICRFQDGVRNKYLSRKYIIKKNEQNLSSDYWYTYYVIKKHFNIIKTKTKNWPNLLIVDGGKLQINAALKALNELEITLPVIGLVKNQFHKTETLELSNGQKIFLQKDTPLYYLLYNMQEAVHNYAVSFFNKKKLDSFFTSLLSTIPNVGIKRRKALMEHFATISELRNAPIEQIAQIVPFTVAKEIVKKIKEYDFQQWKQKF